MKLVTIVSII